MKRVAAALGAILVVLVGGCGDKSKHATKSTKTAAAVTSVTSPTTSTAAAPPASTKAITVRREPSGGTKHFQAGGRSWRGCGATVFNDATGDDLYGISVSGPVDCAAAIRVFTALAEYVQQHQTATNDCFPGYCDPGNPRPTLVAGYRCNATDYGDVSISLSIVCRRGSRYVSAGAADDE